VSADLQHAHVFVSVLGDDEEQVATMKGLKSATPYLRGELGRQMRTKYLPELIFELDTIPQEAERIEKLLHDLDYPREEEGEE
jgi:ribosome-binding factor A